MEWEKIITAAGESRECESAYLPLFVYGSLKPGEANYETYLAGRTLLELPAVLRRAALYTAGSYPYVVVDPSVVRVEDEVRGVLVTLGPEQYVETLGRIDWLEDYKPLSPWSLYLRTSWGVETEQGPAEAWMYVAGPRVVDGIRAGRLKKIAGGVWTSRAS